MHPFIAEGMPLHPWLQVDPSLTLTLQLKVHFHMAIQWFSHTESPMDLKKWTSNGHAQGLSLDETFSHPGDVQGGYALDVHEAILASTIRNMEGKKAVSTLMHQLMDDGAALHFICKSTRHKEKQALKDLGIFDLISKAIDCSGKAASMSQQERTIFVGD
ncbi:unnamed protein product [Darwinula stevensoni]|uniref:Uncharacterized protein n=1 Tax=Darwinula stevensoni TaxID=69355 RepID=A0A7R9AC37_9CRUS|nr:unnamed protein product [Darwinula stevensoni]CAG0900022.1 unnamed protein product [Darwinula stevensoni]